MRPSYSGDMWDGRHPFARFSRWKINTMMVIFTKTKWVSSCFEPRYRNIQLFSFEDLSNPIIHEIDTKQNPTLTIFDGSRYDESKPPKQFWNAVVLVPSVESSGRDERSGRWRKTDSNDLRSISISAF